MAALTSVTVGYPSCGSGMTVRAHVSLTQIGDGVAVATLSPGQVEHVCPPSTVSGVVAGQAVPMPETGPIMVANTDRGDDSAGGCE